MTEITKSITFLNEYKTLKEAVQQGKTPLLAVGLSAIHKAHLAAALGLDTGRPVCMLTDDDTAAARLALDLQAFAEREVLTLPARELVMADVVGVSRGYEQKRLAVLDALPGAAFSVASVQAAVQRTLPPDALQSAVVQLAVGQTVPLETLTQQLTRAGYERCVQVEGMGQFSVRGGILDVFPPQSANPYRVEFWDDEIDSIATFDVGSQRRLETAQTLRCLPCMETLPHLAPGGAKGLAKAVRGLLSTRKKKHPDLAAHIERDAERLEETGALPAADKYLPLVYPALSTALDYLPENAIVLIEDTPRLRDAARDFAARIADDVTALLERGEIAPGLDGYALDFAALARMPRTILRLDSFLNNVPELAPQHLENFVANQMNAYGGNLDMAAADIRGYTQQGRAVAVLCGSALRCRNMCDALTEAGLTATVSDLLPKGGQVCVMEGTLSAGFEYPDLGLVVITEGQVLARRKKAQVKKSNRDRVKSFTDLTPGDLVVHEHHGIGRFVGMERMTVDGAERDFIKIAFAGTDFLYVPATSLDLISKYIGGGEPEKVRLNKLGGADWSRSKARAKAAAKELAEGLIKLYAERAKVKGFAFPQDDTWQREFEEAFPYEETDDQLRCIAEIKMDMESDRPMDRLLCGDVGFGKTEVAIRAAFKAAVDGKQVAVLVPTTILALQHYRSFSERLRDFPVRVEYLNRTKTAKEAGQIRADLESGRIDILIGTHKILGKQIKFRDLGLLIIDEEQKFGVAAKEKLTQMAVNVDTLTLTATPIPRTLQFSLMGSRDLSVISTPPPNRQPIVTESHVFSEEIIRDAVEAELARGGQVYFVHNRVEDLMSIQGLITRVCPKARVAVGHGKMPAEKLEKLIMDFIYGEFDVLVSTTIIENGIDIPNANTIIVDNAQNFGLSDLHQLRGRVGRSNQKAYCYLLSPPEEMLSSDARRRLRAIEEFSDLGSGFNIAMQDLDIRGAGNLLGAEQSGFIADIGFETYQKIMNEAIAELRAEGLQVAGLGAAEQDVVEQMHYVDDAHIEIEVEAGLPDAYVAQQAERLKLYRELDSTKDEAALQAFESRLADRFGPLPREAQELLNVVRLRWEAIRLGIERVKVKNGLMILHFVGEQNSPYYKSDTFMELLRKVTQNPARFVLKQHNNRLAMTVRNVKDIEDGYKTLQQL